MDENSCMSVTLKIIVHMSVTRIHNDQPINDVYFGQVDESKQ